MGGKQSTAGAEPGRLTDAEVHLSKGIFRQVCQSTPEKGCTYDEFLSFCEKIHPLLTQFLVEFYFGNDTTSRLETYREFISIYTYLVRGSLKDKTKMMEVILLQLKSDPKKSKDLSPASLFIRKLVSLDVNYDIYEHTFRMRQENYLRGLICSYIKIEYASESEEFNSWRRVKSRFSIADIDKLTRTLQANMDLPSSSEDMAKWVRIWKTVSLLHSVVYGHFFGLEDLQTTKSLYPFCDCKHRHNVCLMDMCSIVHLNSYLPPKFRHYWRLLFSSAIHGTNFRHILDRVLYEGPNLVVIRDRNNHVFGGFASETWRPSSNFYGNFMSFLFQLHPNLAVYAASGVDENYQFINLKGYHRGFGMGKGPLNLYGWWIEPERLRGSCALSCYTYQGLPVLAGTQHFEIHTFEIWGVDDAPVKRKKKGNIRFHTYAEGLMADSNIRSAGQILLKRTGVRRYTDGYTITKATQKWQSENDEEAHRLEEKQTVDEEKEEEEEEEEDEESEDEDTESDDSDREIEANKVEE